MEIAVAWAKVLYVTSGALPFRATNAAVIDLKSCADDLPRD